MGELRVARDAAGVRLGFRRRWSASYSRVGVAVAAGLLLPSPRYL